MLPNMYLLILVSIKHDISFIFKKLYIYCIYCIVKFLKIFYESFCLDINVSFTMGLCMISSGKATGCLTKQIETSTSKNIKLIILLIIMININFIYYFYLLIR